MPVLLIAESSEYLRHALKNALSGDYEVHTVSDGYEALEQLNFLRPDGLIINLSLAYMDGLSVLQKTHHKPAVVIALYAIPSSYIFQALREAGCTLAISMPCTAWAVADRLRVLLSTHALPSTPPDLQEQAADLLSALGVPAHLSGYKMLCLAITLFAQDPLQALSKETYPAVAELLGGKYACRAIEHDIRSAIGIAWYHRDPALWREYFPKHRKPTNKQFIAAVASRLQNNPSPYADA